jgi:glycosyltransferase involved in cell wall biosynthesis
LGKDAEKLNDRAIVVLILTFNEEKHVARSINSVLTFTNRVVVVDSYSTDRTVEIARAMGATVLQHEWEHNHARQFNWALDNAPIEGAWVMRLDADEYVTPRLAEEISSRVPGIGHEVSGIYVNRRVHFLGRRLRWGSIHPMWVLRLWRHGRGRVETRWMDEHVRVLNGVTTRFNNEIVDENLNDLTWWIAKHNGYAVREAADLLNIKYKFADYDGIGAGSFLEQTKLKRRLKEKIYSRLPLFLRPATYFFYRYFVRLGFLDGVPGLIWHVLQSFWYRFLVDAKIYEIERKAKQQNTPIAELIKQDWQLR